MTERKKMKTINNKTTRHFDQREKSRESSRKTKPDFYLI